MMDGLVRLKHGAIRCPNYSAAVGLDGKDISITMVIPAVIQCLGIPLILLLCRSRYAALQHCSDGMDAILSPKSAFNPSKRPATSFARELLRYSGAEKAINTTAPSSKVSSSGAGRIDDKLFGGGVAGAVTSPLPAVEDISVSW